MKIYKVTIYPVTAWSVRVKAKNEKDAKRKALNLDAPPCYVFEGGNEEWEYDIMEWPNIGVNGQVDIDEE